jgi:hypothetical protein
MNLFEALEIITVRYFLQMALLDFKNTHTHNLNENNSLSEHGTHVFDFGH